MPATDPNVLIDQGKCFSCLGLSLAESMILAELDTISQEINVAPVDPNNKLTLTPPVGAPTVIDNPVGDYSFANQNWIAVKALNCPGLTGLDFTNCVNLASFDVTGCPALITLTITGSALTAIDLTGCASGFGNLSLSANNSLTTLNAATMNTASGIDLNGCMVLGAISFPALLSISPNSFSAAGCTTCLTIDLPALSQIQFGSLILSSCISVTSINAPLLTSSGGDVDVSSCNSLTSLTLTSLNSVAGSFNAANCTSLAALSMASLTSLGQNLQFDNCPTLVTANFSNLPSVGGVLSGNNCAALTTVTLTSLTSVANGISINGCPSLVTLNLSSVSSIGFDSSFDSDTSLVALTLNATWPFPDGIQFTAFNCALNAASVNDALIKADAAGLTGTVIDISGGTSAAPSGAGATAKTNLIAAGNTVNTN